jgi:hypothetical protein
MSKNNVNPDHYKVAGRARQGEDIAQIRNRQRYAEALVRERAERGARSRKQARQGATAASGTGPTRSVKTASRKTSSPPLKTPPGHKRGQRLVTGSSSPHARFSKAARGAALGPTTAAPPRKAMQAATRAPVNLRQPDARGKRPTTQKRAASRKESASMPAAKAVSGGSRKERSPRRRPTRK